MICEMPNRERPNNVAGWRPSSKGANRMRFWRSTFACRTSNGRSANSGRFFPRRAGVNSTASKPCTVQSRVRLKAARSAELALASSECSQICSRLNFDWRQQAESRLEPTRWSFPRFRESRRLLETEARHGQRFRSFGNPIRPQLKVSSYRRGLPSCFTPKPRGLCAGAGVADDMQTGFTVPGNAEFKFR
jgi:hypothetical protein